MPKKEPVLRYKDMTSPTVVSRASVISTVSADHGALSGLNDDDHSAVYPGYAQAETISGDWTFTGDLDASAALVSLDCAAPDANSVNVAASSEGSNTTYSRSDHTHNLDEGIAPTWTAGHTFQATMTTRDLLPEATDTYDIGSSTYWYSQQFVSQINAAVFAEEQIMLLGGWLYVSHDAGTFAAEVGSGDTTIDFGKAMTVSDFVVVKAYDKTSTVKTEYLQVGALVSGTTYNVTRDLAAAHGTDPNWAEGTPFAVLGQTGDGRIELNAYDTPRIQIIVQDDAVTYSNTTEYLRIGDMNGAFGSDAADEWGLGVGDYSGGNYLTYNTTDGFEIKGSNGNLTFDADGIAISIPTSRTASRSYQFTYSGSEIATVTGYRDNLVTNQIRITLAANSGSGLDSWALVYADADTGQKALSGLWADSDHDSAWLNVISDDNTSAAYIEVSDHTLFINDTANANMTIGLTVNQADNDDEVLALKSSDVAHGGYGTEADTYFVIQKAEPTSGGALLRSWKDSDGTAGAAMQVSGNLDENVDTTKSTAGRAIVEVWGLETSGGAVANTVADGNVFNVRTRRGGSYVTVAIIDEDGDLHLDGSNAGTFDEYDDALAVADLAQGIGQQWDNAIRYNFDTLREMGVISGGDRNRPFISTKKLNALMMGAIGQLHERCQELERKLLTA